MRVLVFSRCYLPGFRGGGPVRSLANLVQALGSECDFRIVTLDRDLEQGPAYPGVRVREWQVVGPAQVLYLPREDVSVRRLAREVTQVSPTVIYLNSIFDSIFTVKVLVARRLGLFPAVPILLAPQGELSVGALGIKSQKKAAYLKVARWLGLHRGLIWQASNDAERAEILHTMKEVRQEQVRVAEDLTDAVPVAPFENGGERSRGVLRICFLSRISPKKNLDYALQVLAHVKAPAEFTIYGPVEDAAYWAECQALIRRLPPHVRATYGGEVLPAQVRQTLAAHDLFLFPTRGENFGHVIFEALSAGVPVLISDQTPWSDVASHGAGWCAPLQSPELFAHAIEAASAVLPTDRDAVARRAIAYAHTKVDRAASSARVLNLFREVASR